MLLCRQGGLTLDELLPADGFGAEEIWQRFSFDMNTSGKYFAIKEALKPVILEVVREKYLKYTSFITDEEVEVSMFVQSRLIPFEIFGQCICCAKRKDNGKSVELAHYCIPQFSLLNDYLRNSIFFNAVNLVAR